MFLTKVYDTARRHPVRAFLLLLIGLIIVAGFLPVPLNRLTPRIEKEAVKLTKGDTLRIENLTLQLWRGISLTGVSYVTQAKKEPSIRLTVPRVRLSYALLSILWGKVDVHKIVVSNPTAEITLSPTSSASGSAPVKGSGMSAMLPLPIGKIPMDLPVNLEIRDLYVENARLNALLLPDMKIRAKGVDLHLSASLTSALSLKGTLRADSLYAPVPYAVAGFKADLSLEPGRLQLSDCGFSVYEGRCRLSATLDAAADTLLNASFSLKGLSLRPLLKVSGFNRGSVTGIIALDMKVSGRTLDPNRMRGRGTFKATKLDLSGLPFQNTLAMLLFLPDMKHLKFERITSSLNLANGRIFTPDMVGLGNLMNIKGSGYAGLDMNVNEKVRISLAPAMCRRLPSMISQGVMQPEPGGRCGAGGELTGPLSDMKISLDAKTKARATATILKEAGSLLRNLFKNR